MVVEAWVREGMHGSWLHGDGGGLEGSSWLGGGVKMIMVEK